MLISKCRTFTQKPSCASLMLPHVGLINVDNSLWPEQIIYPLIVSRCVFSSPRNTITFGPITAVC